MVGHRDPRAADSNSRSVHTPLAEAVVGVLLKPTYPATGLLTRHLVGWLFCWPDDLHRPQSFADLSLTTRYLL